MYMYINIWYPPQKKPTFSHFVPVFTVFCAFLRAFFFKGIFLLILEVVFINVYKHRGSWIQDPRSKILGKTSWIQGLDPRSKIQDSRKNFLDPDLGSKKFCPESWILDLGSRPWIQINCYGSIVFINVYKGLETCQNPPDRKRDSGKAQSIGKSRLILIHPMSELRIFWANSHLHSPESIFRISVTFL